tara:strand:+ start:76 stop:834 length:759 start_codon:yes stop_codon:yes gene_type:complete
MIDLIKNNSSFYIRIVLFLAFFGHGLVSLKFSSNYVLHYGILESVNFSSIDTEILLLFHACLDILLAFLIIFNIRVKQLMYFCFGYIFTIAIASLIFYWSTTGSIFGIAEFLRRAPWLFLILFIISDVNSKPRYNFIRIGLSFAFLAHGLASLGFMGLNQGHIELAGIVMSQEQARDFVTYTGFSDTILGIMLLQSLFTKKVALISIVWIAFIVYLSFMNAWPDALFRSGFLLLALYIYLDDRTYIPKLIKL